MVGNINKEHAVI